MTKQKENKKIMIYVTGDTHGGWIHRLNTDVFPEQKEMTKNDYVIICGDFGIWDNSKEQKYNLDWLEKKPFTTLFVDGNHENFDILDNLPVTTFCGGTVHKIRPSVIHLMRGQVFTINDHTFFTFGGAQSHDIRDGILDKNDPNFRQRKYHLDHHIINAQYRINHSSWWAREMPSKEEMEEGWENLKKHDFKVDYIITHAPYSWLLPQMDGGSNIFQPDELTDYLQQVKQNTDYKHWLFGHMHCNHTFYWERASCIYEQITRIL